MGGISATTPNYILYGTDGYITVNAVDLGATEDALSVEWSAEHYYPDLAQARGNVSGTGKVVAGTFDVKCKITQWQYSVLSTLLGSYGISSDANSETLGSGALATITEVTNVILTGISRNDGKAFKVTVPKAWVEVGNIDFNYKCDTTLELTFHGLYTTALPTTLPGKIQFAV